MEEFVAATSETEQSTIDFAPYLDRKQKTNFPVTLKLTETFMRGKKNVSQHYNNGLYFQKATKVLRHLPKTTQKVHTVVSPLIFN